MNFLIISGLSGSGKTIALQALEDIGYYCIDNLPAVLLPHFAAQLQQSNHDDHEHAAVSIDSRNRSFLDALTTNVEQVRALGLNCQIVFLEAEQSVLLKRFSETRRKHPLTNEKTPLIDGIQLEKQLLEPLARNATRHIDTTSTTPQELRRMMREFAGGLDTNTLSLLFESFGYKHGTPQDADFVFDVRCLPNPYWESELRALSGEDQAVIDFLSGHEQVQAMIDQINTFIERWLPSFEAEHRSYITVAIGCTGGRHRSVYVAKKLADYFSESRLNVHIRHRDLP